jgi:hypothetical protein
VNKEHLFDELGRIERDVVHGERQLAEQEELLVALKKSERGLGASPIRVGGLLRRQEALQQERFRILSLLQP